MLTLTKFLDENVGKIKRTLKCEKRDMNINVKFYTHMAQIASHSPFYTKVLLLQGDSSWSGLPLISRGGFIWNTGKNRSEQHISLSNRLHNTSTTTNGCCADS